MSSDARSRYQSWKAGKESKDATTLGQMAYLRQGFTVGPGHDGERHPSRKEGVSGAFPMSRVKKMPSTYKAGSSVNDAFVMDLSVDAPSKKKRTPQKSLFQDSSSAHSSGHKRALSTTIGLLGPIPGSKADSNTVASPSGRSNTTGESRRTSIRTVKESPRNALSSSHASRISHHHSRTITAIDRRSASTTSKTSPGSSLRGKALSDALSHQAEQHQSEMKVVKTNLMQSETSLKLQVKQLSSDLAEALRKKGEAELSLQTIEEDWKNARTAFASDKRRMEELASTISSVSDRRRKNVSEVSSLKDELDSRNAELSRLRDDQSRTEAALVKASTQRDKLWNGLAQAVKQRDSLRSKEIESEQTIADLRAQISALNKDGKVPPPESIAGLSERQTQAIINGLKRKLQQTQVRLEEIEENASTQGSVMRSGHEKEVASLTNQLITARKEKNEFEKQCRELKEEHEREVDEIDFKLKSKIDELRTANHDIDKLKKEMEEVQYIYEKKLQLATKPDPDTTNTPQANHNATSVPTDLKAAVDDAFEMYMGIRDSMKGSSENDALINEFTLQLSKLKETASGAVTVNDFPPEGPSGAALNTRIEQLSCLLEESMSAASVEYGRLNSSKKELENQLGQLQNKIRTLEKTLVERSAEFKEELEETTLDAEEFQKDQMNDYMKLSRDYAASQQFLEESREWLARMSSELAVYVAVAVSERQHAEELEENLLAEREQYEHALQLLRNENGKIKEGIENENPTVE